MNIDGNLEPASLSDEEFLGFVHDMTHELTLMARERGFHKLATGLLETEVTSGKLCALASRRNQQRSGALRRTRPPARAAC